MTSTLAAAGARVDTAHRGSPRCDATCSLHTRAVCQVEPPLNALAIRHVLNGAGSTERLPSFREKWDAQRLPLGGPAPAAVQHAHGAPNGYSYRHAADEIELRPLHREPAERRFVREAGVLGDALRCREIA